MGMKKLNAVMTTAEVDALPSVQEARAEYGPKQVESGATAAIERLSKPKLEKQTSNPAYKARDYEAEALGKTRCVQFEAALMSPAIAGLRFDSLEQFLDLVRKAADAGVAYSFQKDK